MSEKGVPTEEWWKCKEGEVSYLHWNREEPETQIQLAFRNHWTLFQELISDAKPQGKRCVELGCGRGTMSMYFADADWDCTLVDMSSLVLDAAKGAFSAADLDGKFVEADATDTQLEGDYFDVCVSIGLLEHMVDLEKALEEQLRLLRKGGLLLAYVVPETGPKAQEGWEWLNNIFKMYSDAITPPDKSVPGKVDLYRSDAGSDVYFELLAKMPIENVQASGVYSLPMLSPSINFPFTLNPENVEKELVKHFKEVLDQRKKDTSKHPWLCAEDYGQAFLVWGQKT